MKGGELATHVIYLLDFLGNFDISESENIAQQRDFEGKYGAF
jgi:hypothetical protein